MQESLIVVAETIINLLWSSQIDRSSQSGRNKKIKAPKQTQLINNWINLEGQMFYK